MYLIESMIKRGLTVDDMIELIKSGEIEIEEKVFIEQFNKELKLLENKEENLKKICNILKNNSVADGKAYMIAREYAVNGGQLKPGYITNMYFNNNIEQNPYLLVFLFNRVIRINNFRPIGYNAEFLYQKRKEIEKKISEYSGEKKEEKDSLKLEDHLKKIQKEEEEKLELKRMEEERKKIKKEEETSEEVINPQIENILETMRLNLINYKLSEQKNKKPKKDEDSKKDRDI